jgi:predicted nucleotidyltransferase
MNRDELLAQVKRVVHEIEPDAEIILYGSRARGDAQPDSDWDLLILLDGVVDWKRKEKISHRLLNVELEYNEVLLAIVRSQQEWNSPLYRAMPLHKNISREGIQL